MKNDMEKYQFIGSRIRQAREKAGMSQQDLAESVDYDSATAISLIEAGKRKVSVEDLEKIAHILHKDIKDFLGHEQPKPDVRIALRADKDLGIEEEKEILNFINYVKDRKSGKR